MYDRPEIVNQHVAVGVHKPQDQVNHSSDVNITVLITACMDSSQLPYPQGAKQEYVELVSGSGVYIPAYKLEDATRDAKTGTQLARKLMDAFWDKDTLAKSTLTPRSKFQYQQLDPTVIKSIEGTYYNTGM